MTESTYHQQMEYHQLSKKNVGCVEIVDDDDDDIPFWMCVWEDIGDCYENAKELIRKPSTKRWFIRLVVYPGLITGAVVLVLNLRNLPKVYKHIGSVGVKYVEFPHCDKCLKFSKQTFDCPLMRYMGKMYLTAAPIGLLYNVCCGIFAWPMVLWNKFHGYQVPCTSWLRVMRFHGEPLWCWGSKIWFKG